VASSQLLGLTLPAQLGPYRVERLMSDGGSASYADYEAHHRMLGHAVMVRHERWLAGQWAESSDDTIARTLEYAREGLRRSRRLQAELQHPRILPVIDFFDAEGEWFSVFARIPSAQSLHDVARAIRKNARPPVSIAEFVAVSAGVTDGLAAIHAAGFVHRTLGKDNVLIDDDGRVLLADLGCATPVDADDGAAKAFRLFMRAASAAPEQFAIEGVFSPAIDNWALGIALFELRYGRHPFWTKAPTTFEGARLRILEGSLTFPPVLDATAEDLLQPWLRRLLAPAPERRYSDALEAQRDLQAIAAEIEGRRPVARAFVAMPFADAFEPLWRAIRSACVTCRVAATRVDQSHRHESIWDEITDAVRSAEFTIAVAAPESAGVPNPNVMLEVGYARALHKPVLILTDDPATLPFDLRTQRALVYRAASVNDGEFHRELVAYLSAIVAQFSRDQMPETS
jgi:tRNA A-37 threonylcarbamoyl transferase component Bud32